MRRIFSIEGGLYSGFSFIYKLILLNVYFIIGSLGIVTIGVSLTALYYCMMKILKKEDGRLWEDFIKSYRENLYQGLLLSLVLLLFFILSFSIVGVGMTVFNSQLIAFLGLVNCGLVFFVTTYSFMLLGQFHNTIKKILINSIFLILKNMGTSIIIFLLPAVFLVLIPLYLPKLMFVMLLLSLSLIAYTQTYFFKKIINEFID